MRKKSDFAIFLITLLFACLCAGPVRAQDTGPAGSSQPMDIRKPILTLNYLICTNGNFPFHDQTGLGAVDLTTPFLGQICIGAFPSTNLPPDSPFARDSLWRSAKMPRSFPYSPLRSAG